MGAMDVAVKQLQSGASEEEKVKFLQEAAINGQFRHPNVVQLMGVVTVGEPVSWLPGINLHGFFFVNCSSCLPWAIYTLWRMVCYNLSFKLEVHSL